jgi:hypothetical protein
VVSHRHSRFLTHQLNLHLLLVVHRRFSRLGYHRCSHQCSRHCCLQRNRVHNPLVNRHCSRSPVLVCNRPFSPAITPRVSPLAAQVIFQL